ncbi:hypothetical protein [Kozakia baliensis]|nr:hypothetical protein [Kozakia baliensis]GEL64312.1 hypothetical protein KBA01_15980 [Kozakia baliensis]
MTTAALLLNQPMHFLSELSMLAFLPAIAALLIATIAADRTA